MSEESFLSYRGYRWLWITVGVLALFVMLYLVDRPLGGRNGGTVLGYTYGIIAFLGIMYLMWYGIRKRSYHARYTTLKGCLSAHVYLGLALILLVPLHSGFEFGWNVHTLAYVLMAAVIVSGIWGAVAYVHLAPEIESHRGGGSVKRNLEQIATLSDAISNALKDRSDRLVQIASKIDIDFAPSLGRALFKRGVSQLDRSEVAALVSGLSAEEREQSLNVIGLVNKKREIVSDLMSEVRTLTALRIWLYIHLPLACALLGAVLIHILSVLYFRT